MRTFPGFLTVAVALAADSAPYKHITDRQLTDKGQELHGKMQAGLASETLGDWGNHQVVAAHREATGQAEYHENQADVIVVRKGAGSMVIGGKVVNGKTTAPGEIRGEKIDGGQTIDLKPGDVIHIAPKTPHMVVLKKGQKIDYIALKVDAK
jgi:mannose-6-phosphate isomerase-like protein (cupin superfamily)